MPAVRPTACRPLSAVAARTQAATCYGAAYSRRWPAAGAVRQARRQPAQIAPGAACSSVSGADGAGACDEPELVMRYNYAKMVPMRPELAAELRPLAALAGVADAAALSRAVASLGPKRERGVLQHGAAVAQLLLSLGVPQLQLAELLHRCPLLFSWPAEQRAAVLFRQLARLGLTAGEAARCFEKQPTAAGVVSFEPAIAVLADLFAAGSTSSSSKGGEQLLGDLLRNQPTAVVLLRLQPSTLQQRISNLVQRYGPHWEQPNKRAVIVAAMTQYDSLLLTRPPERLLALEAVLQQEVGQQPGDGTCLLACILQRKARAASCSPETLQQRVQALVAEFGLERLLQAGPESLAQLLCIGTANWKRALAVWQLLGVADPATLGLRNTHSLLFDWLAPDRLASLAALQQLLPWQPSVADAVQQFSGYVTSCAPPRLMGRLLFLQQEGVLPLLVADKRAARKQWRQERRVRAGEAAGEPQFISVCDAATLSDAKLCALLEQAEAALPDQPVGSGSDSGGGGVAERYEAFLARLPHLPAYQRLLAAGEAESRRLAALLPPELVAGKKEQQQEQDGRGI